MRSHQHTTDKLTMQRRHFQFIAEILNSTRPAKPTRADQLAAIAARGEWDDIVGTFARALSHTNPQFDHSAFIDACMNGEP